MGDQAPPPPPPPYTEPEAAAAEAFLERCVQARRIDHSRPNVAQTRTASVETEINRVRNLLLFTLSVDYQCNPGVSLSASDREHFTSLHNMLRDLDHSHETARPDNAERQKLASYFWKYLHEPCKELDIPVELVLISIRRLLKFVDYRGEYKGCCYGVLHTYGLDALARKLYLDSKIIAPAVMAEGPGRLRMRRAISEFGCHYFDWFHGFEGSTMPASGPDFNRGWDCLQSISYDANERGLNYERLRKQSGATSSLSLSMKHLTLMATECVARIFQRHRRVEEGKQVADPQTNWRGDVRPTLPSRRDGKRHAHEYPTPSGWRWRSTIHVPDLFEERTMRGESNA